MRVFNVVITVVSMLGALTAFMALQSYAAGNTAEFVKRLSMQNLYIIKTGELAKERAKEVKTQQFATMLVQDHRRLGEDLRLALHRAGMDDAQIAIALDEDYMEDLGALQDEDNNDFDSSFLETQEDVHDDMLAQLKEYAEEGREANLKHFAQQYVALLKRHEEVTDQLD